MKEMSFMDKLNSQASDFLYKAFGKEEVVKPGAKMVTAKYEDKKV